MARKSTKKKVQPKRRPKTVKPIPSGFRSVTAYLVVHDGNAAIDFYKKAFGAKELTRSLSPTGKIMNAQIKIGDSIIMLSDEMAGADVKSPFSLGSSTVTLHVYSKDVEKLWEQVVSKGARISMPLENQFWGERYGQIVDPFGHRWSLSQQIRMSRKEREERQKAAMAMFAQSEQSAPLTETGGERPSPAGIS